jgi:hypothetical protein
VDSLHDMPTLLVRDSGELTHCNLIECCSDYVVGLRGTLMILPDNDRVTKEFLY